MKRYAPIVLMLTVCSICFAAEREIIWEKYFDGLESEKLLDIEAAADGGILLLGEIVTVDSVNDNRQFTSSVPFLMETDGAGNTLWHHYYSGFWDSRGTRQDLKILSVADSGVVFGGEKKDAVYLFGDSEGSLTDLPEFQKDPASRHDTTAVISLFWEVSKYYRGERKGNSPRMVDSLDIRFKWTGANRELLRDRTMALQWQPSEYCGWDSGDFIVQGTARQPLTEIRAGINALLCLNADMTTRWMHFYNDPEKLGFWPDGKLVCAPDERLFIFSNPSFGDWQSSFHIVEINTDNGELVYSHGFDRERMHIVDYLSLPNNEYILAGTIFKMLSGNEHVDHRSFDYWLMKVRLP